MESLENQWQDYTGEYSVGSQEQFDGVNGIPDGEYLWGMCSYSETWLVTAGAQNSGDWSGDCPEWWLWRIPDSCTPL